MHGRQAPIHARWTAVAALAIGPGPFALAHAPADGVVQVPACITHEQMALLERAPRTLREYAGTRGWTPGEDASAELEAISPELARLGTALAGPCRWNIDQASTSVDPEPWRALQRLLDADSRRLARTGQWDAATDRLCAMLAVAGAVGSLDRLDARAAAASMAHAAAERARQFIDRGAPATSALAIVAACDALDGGALFDPCPMVRLERIRWILRAEASAAARVPSAALVESARGERHATVVAGALPPLESMTPAELEIQIRSGEPWFAALASRCGDLDARAAAVELDARASRGEHGAWLEAMRPNMPWAIGELERARGSVRSARERARVAAAGAGLDVPAPRMAPPVPAAPAETPAGDLSAIPSSIGSVAVRRGDTLMRLPYRLVEPSSIAEGSSYPLVVFLHGAGERGDDGVSALRHFADRMATQGMRSRYPCFILAVQCPKEQRWVDADWSAATSPSFADQPTAPMDAVVAAIRTTARSRPVDMSRIYLTGISMGGYGTWDLAARHPSWFAAAVPVCGGGDPATAARFVGLPLRAVHGLQDGVVPPERTRAMVAAIRAAGGAADLLEPDCGHDAWTVAYTPDGALDWMFAQRRAQPADVGSEPAGGGASAGSAPSAPAGSPSPSPPR
jgi:dienelactone hydrolase